MFEKLCGVGKVNHNISGGFGNVYKSAERKKDKPGPDAGRVGGMS